MIDFNLFMYCTVGRPDELKRGMAGKDANLFRRMLDEIAGYAKSADELGYAGFGHPEHHEVTAMLPVGFAKFPERMAHGV